MTNLFQTHQDNRSDAEKLADGFLMEANQQFEALLESTYSAVERFWYRNRDSDGNPALDGDEPTGLEIMAAMGADAEKVYGVAVARIQMLISIQTSLGRSDLIDMNRIMGPYTLTFNFDGSLDTHTPRT